MIYTTNRINARIAAVKAEAERLRQEAEKKVIDTLEPSGMIKNTIISKQSELISRCYDEKTADNDMIQLKAEIEAEKERLSSRPLSKMIPWSAYCEHIDGEESCLIITILPGTRL